MAGRSIDLELDRDDAGHAYADPPEGFDATALHRAGLSISLSDPSLPDNPLVYVNRAFVRITGYAPQDVLGKNCRILQGDMRDQPAAAELRAAIAAGREITVDIMNQRADGSRFTNRLVVSPLHRDDGTLDYFIGMQTELPEGTSDAETAQDLRERMDELQHRVKNHLSIIVGMIRTEARQHAEIGDRVRVLADRVQALSLLYEQVDAQSAQRSVEVRLDAYLGRVVSALEGISDRPGVAVTYSAEDLRCTVDTAAQIGMLLSELMTNALRHAFADREEGRCEVTLEEAAESLMLTVEDDGVGLAGDWPEGGNLGSRIVRGLVQRLFAEITVSEGTGGRGTRITVAIPKPQAGTGGVR